jgi:hypothetical protein
MRVSASRCGFTWIGKRRASPRLYLAGTAPFQDDVHARALVFDFLAAHASGLLGWAERAKRRVRAWAEETPEERAADVRRSCRAL